MANIFKKIKSKISDKRRKINSKEDNTLKKEENPDSLEQIMKDFFDDPNTETVKKLEKHVESLESKYQRDGFMLTTGFKYYIKNDKSKMEFRDVAMAFRTIDIIISMINRDFKNKIYLEKWKQKGIEYFDHLKSNLNDLVEKLDASQRENIVKSIEIYRGYADKLGYTDAEYVLGKLEIFCAQNSLEKIMEGFFENPTKDNAEKASTFTAQLMQFKRYNPQLIAAMSAGFPCYVRPEAEISKLDFRKTLAAIRTLYTIIDLGSSAGIKNDHLNKFKQKGIEYFDHLKSNLNDLVEKLDASQRENIVKSIEKGIYNGYAEKIGYPKDHANTVFNELKKLCS